MAERSRAALHLSMIAVSAALTAVFTIIVRIPVPATAGYISLCDAAVVFSAYAFGPLTGFIAGGLGSAFADLLGGYPQFALISFAVHGLEAFLAGLLVRRNSGSVLNMMVTLTIVSVPGFVLRIRSVLLGVVDQDYIHAARVSGTGMAMIFVSCMGRHRPDDS